MLTAHQAVGVTAEFQHAHLTAQGVNVQHATNQGPPSSQDQLHRFHSLYTAHQSWQDAQYAGLGATRRGPRRWRFRKETAVTGAMTWREDGGLSLELEDRAVHQWFLGHHAGIVDQVAGREVVAPIHDDIKVRDDAHDVLGPEALVKPDHLDIRVQGVQGLLCGCDLGHADAIIGVKNLSLQVTQIDDVVIDNPNRPHASRSQIERGRRSQATSANTQDFRVQQLRLALFAHLWQHEV